MKKNLTIISSVLVLLLVAVIAFALFTPIVTVNGDLSGVEKELKKGSYTSQFTYVENYELGLPWIIEIISNYKDAKYIFQVQAYEDEIDGLEEQLSNAEGEYANTLRGKINELNSKILNEYNKYGDKEAHEKLTEKFKDEDFCRILGTMTLMQHIISGEYNEISSSNGITPIKDTLLIRGIVFVILFALMIILLLCSAIISIVFVIITLVKLIKNAKKLGSANAFANISASPVYTVSASILLPALAITALLGKSAAISVSAIAVIALAIVIALLRAIIATISCNSKEKVIASAIKNAITLLSIVALILISVSFTNVNILDEYITNANSAAEVYSETLSEDYLQNAQTESELINAVSRAKSDSTKNYKSKNLLGLVSTFAVPFVLMIAFICLIGRLGQTVEKSKNGGYTNYKNNIVIAVILVIAVALPMVGKVSSPEDREEAYKKGEFVVLYDAYKHEDTDEKLAYDLLVKEKEEVSKELDSALKEYEAATESQKEEMKESLDLIKSADARMNVLLSASETNKEGAIILGFVGAIMLLALEIAYVCTPKTPYTMLLVTSKSFEEQEESDN